MQHRFVPILAFLLVDNPGFSMRIQQSPLQTSGPNSPANTLFNRRSRESSKESTSPSRQSVITSRGEDGDRVKARAVLELPCELP